MNNLFVYGTLKKGFRLNPFLVRASFIKEDILPGFTLFDLGPFPFATPSGEKQVVGEIFSVDEDTLDILDTIEFGAGFSRETRKTQSGEEVNVYVIDDPAFYPFATEIEDGVWRKK